MVQRYCISPVIGTGTEQDQFRAAVSDVADGCTSLIPSVSMEDGNPKYRFAFSLVATNNLPAVLAVTNAYVFPDYPLDGQLISMESEVRAGMVQSVPAYDLDGNGLHLTVPNDDEQSFREVLASIGQQFEPAFSVDSFSVSSG